MSRRGRNGRTSPERETGIFDITRCRKLLYASALQFLKALQRPAQFPANFTESQAGSALPGNYGVVRRAKETFVVPVKLPDQPLEAVSGDCIAYLAAHGYSYSYGGNWGLRPEDNEAGRMDLVPLTGNPQKISSFQEPLIPGETGHVHRPYLTAMVTASRLRPLARLLLMTSLPFLVDMRTRNPWVLFRDVLLG